MPCDLQRLILTGTALPNLIIDKKQSGGSLALRSRENRNRVGDRGFQGALLGAGNKNYAPTMRWTVRAIFDRDELLLFEQYVLASEEFTAFTLEDYIRRLPATQGIVHNRQAIAGTSRTALGFTESFYRFSVRIAIRDDNYVEEAGGLFYNVNFELAEIALPQ